MAVTSVATWFGPEDESLFGCYHLPADGRIRGAVLICPPLAQEVTRAQAALRALACSLAERGLLALRFDYLGTGDSALDSSRPGAVERWLSSIVEAHAFLVKNGIDEIGLVGLRTGALLVSNALERLSPVRAVGLWDPVSSGRRFIRQEQALYTVAVHPSEQTDDGVIEGVGISFDAELQADLRRLKLSARDLGQAPRAAVFQTAATAQAKALDATFDGSGVELVTIPGRYEDGPSDVSFFAGRLPTTAIRMITGWADDCMPAAFSDRPARIDTRDVATMVTDAGAVRETLVAMPRDPAPGWLHGVVTEPVEGLDAARARPAALILNISVVGRIGPTRGWVTSARKVAASGMTAVRFDRYGLGESIDDSVGYVAKDYDADAVNDVGVAACFVRPDDPSNVKLAGLCSGAWAASLAAPELRPRELILMNPLYWNPTPFGDEQAQDLGVQWVREPDPRQPPPSLAARLARKVTNQQRRIPPPLAAKLGLIHLPGPVLDALAPETARVTLMFGDEEIDEFAHLGGLNAIRRRSQSTATELVTVYYADHGLVGRRGRERMLDELVIRLSAR